MWDRLPKGPARVRGCEGPTFGPTRPTGATINSLSLQLKLSFPPPLSVGTQEGGGRGGAAPDTASFVGGTHAVALGRDPSHLWETWYEGLERLLASHSSGGRQECRVANRFASHTHLGSLRLVTPLRPIRAPAWGQSLPGRLQYDARNWSQRPQRMHRAYHERER